MAGIYPDWLGNIGTGTGPCPEPEIVYIEVPGGGVGCFTRKIVVSASIILDDKYKRKKTINVKVNRL